MRRKNINDFTEIGFKRFLAKISRIAKNAKDSDVFFVLEEDSHEADYQYSMSSNEGSVFVLFLIDKDAKYTITRVGINIGKTRYEFYCSVDYELFVQNDLYRFYRIYDIVKNRINQKNKKRGIKK